MSYDLEELRRLEALISAEPNDDRTCADCSEEIRTNDEQEPSALHDVCAQSLIVALRNAAPELLERMAKLEALLAAVRAEPFPSLAIRIALRDETTEPLMPLDALTTAGPEVWGIFCIPIPQRDTTSTPRSPDKDGWLKDRAFGGRIELASRCCAETIARLAQVGWYEYEVRRIR